MHYLSAVVAATAAFASLSDALTIPNDAKYVLHEKREAHLDIVAKTKRSTVNAALLPVRIGLTQPDLHRGYDMVMDVSHPESSNYGKHLSAVDVNTVFAPSAKTVQTVRDWLISSGIAADRIKQSDNKGWLAFDAHVEEAEELFRTKYYQAEHPSRADKYSVGCDEYVKTDQIV
jgi:tripeptidyl-peptidase-1